MTKSDRAVNCGDSFKELFPSSSFHLLVGSDERRGQMLTKLVFSSLLLVTLLSVCPMATSQGVAPDFTLPVVTSNGLTGQIVTLSSFRETVVLLQFMEPWCPHCKNMAPIVEELYRQYVLQSVVFLSVAGPWRNATANDAASFIHNYGSSWTYTYDSSGAVFKEYGVNSIPTFVILGTDGSTIIRLEGEQTKPALANAIVQALPIRQPTVTTTSISTSALPTTVLSATASTATTISNQVQIVASTISLSTQTSRITHA